MMRQPDHVNDDVNHMVRLEMFDFRFRLIVGHPGRFGLHGIKGLCRLSSAKTS